MAKPSFRGKRKVYLAYLQEATDVKDIIKVVAFDGQERVGEFLWRPDRRKLYSLFVKPEYRGQGIARTMLDHAVETFGYPICLNSTSFDVKQGLTQAQLDNFYFGYGFRPMPNNPSLLVLECLDRVTARLARAKRRK
jgi:GNAT superfamily N-acetyltransferase